MKPNVLVLAVLVALSTHGSSCIRENFLIPVNLEINECYGINSGPAGAFNPVAIVIPLSPLIDDSFRGDIVDARIYDIKISTQGTYTGTVVAQVYVDNVLLMSIGGGTNNATPVAWSTFSTPQSLLGSSPYVKANAAGIAALVTAAKRMATDDNVEITLRATGSTAGATVPAGLSVCVRILGQADARLNSSGNAGPAD
jgi:hypothetical protein